MSTLLSSKHLRAMMLLCSVGLFAACGDEEPAKNNANNTSKNNANECPAGQVKATYMGAESCRKDCAADASVCGATEQCADAGGNKVCVPKPAAECEEGKVKVGDACVTDCSANENVCQANEECKTEGANKVCRVKPAPPRPDKTAPTCESTPKPARCDADAATFTDWAPASVISAFEIADPDKQCCFDFTGDGIPDNVLGEGLSFQASLLKSANDGIAEGIAEGSLALVLEHQDVSLAGGDFSIAFLLAEPQGGLTAPNAAGGNEYKINPASFEAGTYAQAVALAKLEGADVNAGPGSIRLNIALLGVNLGLTISSVQITAAVDAAASDAAKGVKLDDGKLGGVIRLASLFDAINDVGKDNCGCVKNRGADGVLIAYDPNDVTKGACVAGMDASSCDENDQLQGICKTLVDSACEFLPALAILPDVDADNIGQDCVDASLGLNCNAISVGATFKAVGAKITGVAEPAPAPGPGE